MKKLKIHLKELREPFKKVMKFLGNTRSVIELIKYFLNLFITIQNK